MANFIQGRYTPRNPQKYVGDKADIVFRSAWERKFMIWCDHNPAVVAWTSEYPIQYYSQLDAKTRRYFVDFFVRIRSNDGTEKTLMIEVKPDSQTRPPIKPKINNPKAIKRYIAECETFQVNSDKWDAARAFAAKNNFQFIILNEYDLGIQKRGK